MKAEMIAMLRIRKTVASTALAPAPSGCSSLAMAWEAKAPQP